MGSKHPPFEYSPIVNREFDLPDGNHVAIWVVMNVEHDIYNKPVTTHLTSRTLNHSPDVFNFGWRDYGKRVGFWRLRDVFSEYNVPVTVALNASICDHEPEIVEAGKNLDWEFMCHGETNSERVAGLDIDEEREVIRNTRDKIEEAVGSRPVGWLGPGLTETFNTLEILGEEDFRYVADWANDEIPYLMDTTEGEVIGMPYTLEMNDVPMNLNYNLSAREYEETLIDQFDALYAEGQEEENGKVMTIAVHDYLTGHPHRSLHLANALDHITSHDGVWLATGSEIANHYAKNNL